MKVWMTEEEAKKMAAESEHRTEWFKYVRMSDGPFRFVTIQSHKEHRQMVLEGEKAISAGLVKVSKVAFAFEGYGSTSLHLTWDNQDEVLLVQVLSLPCVCSYDL